MVCKYVYVALIFTLALDSASCARVKTGAMVHEHSGSIARASHAAGPLLDKAPDVQHVQGLDQQPNLTHADNSAAPDITGSRSDPAVVSRGQGLNGSGVQGEVSKGAEPTSAMIALSAATNQVASSISRKGLELFGSPASSSKSLITFAIVACIIVICCCLGILASHDPSQEEEEEEDGQANGKQRGSVSSTGSGYSLLGTSKSPLLGGVSPPALTASWLSVNRERGAGEDDGDSSGGESVAESVRSWMSDKTKSLANSSFASQGGTGERKRDKLMNFMGKKAKGLTKAGAESRGEDPVDATYQFGDATRGLFSKAARQFAK